jgi:hypothetical protein
LNLELPELFLELALLLFCDVSIGCGANRRVAGLESSDDVVREDFAEVSTGSGANLLTVGLSVVGAASLRDDFDDVSIG